MNAQSIEHWGDARDSIRAFGTRIVHHAGALRYRTVRQPPQTKAAALRHHRGRLFSAVSKGILPLTVAEVERLDPDAPNHRTLRITFEGRSDREVFPNDFLSVRWRNDPALVEAVLERLGDAPDRLVRITLHGHAVFPGRSVTTSLRDALTNYIEIQTLSHELQERYGFEHVIAHNQDALRRYRSYHKQAQGEIPPGPGNWEADRRDVSTVSLIDKLAADGVRPGAREFFSHQCQVFLRPYTMSGFERSPDGTFRASITASVVEKRLETADGGTVSAPGRATSYLASLRPGDAAEGFLLPDRHLFPQTLGRDVPLIVVCTGAGIAGPLSLLRAGYRGGPLWVVYGVRNWEDHSLYGEELKSFADAGVIARLDIAESRPKSPRTPKRYVQDVLNHDPDTLVSWLRDGAHLYMGGRLSMGVSVNRAIRDLLTRTGECATEDEANGRLLQWYDELRFQASVSRV
ncbi:MAG: hypothetical protein ACOC4F_02370 [bacterium]